MNAKTLIAASIFALVSSTAAVAQEAIPATWANEASQQTTGAKTRAEVKAELVVARAHGESNPSDLYGQPSSPQFASSTVTRAQVLAELSRARAAGELKEAREFDGGYGYQIPFASTKTRAEVRAEVLQAMHSGEQLSRGDRTGG